MSSRLTSRVRRLERLHGKDQETAPPKQFPGWLLDAWEQAGLQFDRSDINSVREAVRLANAAGRQEPIEPHNENESLG
jgi:hypothetical protein